jgi:SBP domain
MLSLVVDGQPSRFCQQCGRFQAISDFDGDKRQVPCAFAYSSSLNSHQVSTACRSCRQRLLQHNLRRRKRSPATREQTQTSNPQRKSRPKGSAVEQRSPPDAAGAPGLQQVGCPCAQLPAPSPLFGGTTSQHNQPAPDGDDDWLHNAPTPNPSLPATSPARMHGPAEVVHLRGGPCTMPCFPLQQPHTTSLYLPAPVAPLCCALLPLP